MKINIHIDNEDGEMRFATTCLSIESAVQELYRFERNQERESIKRQEAETDTI